MIPDNGAVVTDPGAPMEYSREVPAAPVTPAAAATPTPEQARITALEDQLKEERQNREYWARRAAPVAQPVVEREEEIDETPLVAVPVATQESVDQFIDGLNKDGLEALKKRGFITADQLATALQAFEQRVVDGYSRDVQARQFDDKLSREFPELMEANARIDRGQAANSPLFERTAKHYNALADDTPGLKHNSPAGRALMLAAARMAKTEIESEGKVTTTNEPSRRDRIDAQPGRGRARAGGADTQMEQPTEIGEQSMAIIANLSRYGVTPDKFKANIGAQFEKRNGRG